MYKMLVEKLRLNCAARELWLPLVPQYAEQINLFKEAADAIEELQTYADLYEDLTEESQRVARKVIDNYPKWIPVTERLPNCNGCYLVWRPHFFGGEIGMPSICYFDGSNTWHDSYGVDFERILHPEDVTHWMPLPPSPEPPKED